LGNKVLQLNHKTNYIKEVKIAFYLLMLLSFFQCKLKKQEADIWAYNYIPVLTDSFKIKKVNNHYGFGQFQYIDSNQISFINNNEVIKFNYKSNKLTYFSYKNSTKNTYLWGCKHIDSNIYLLNYNTTYHGYRHDSSFVIYDFDKQKVVQSFCFDSSNLITQSNFGKLEYINSSLIFNRYFIPEYNKKDGSVIVSSINIGYADCATQANKKNGNIIKLYPRESRKPVLDYNVKIKCEDSKFYFEDTRFLRGLVVGDTIIVSSALNNTYTLVNKNDNSSKIIYANPYFLPNQNEMNIDSLTARENNYSRNFINYTQLIYDKFTKSFYREVVLPVDKNSDPKYSNNAQFGLIKMDSNLNVEGFIHLPYKMGYVVSTPKGLLGLNWAKSENDSFLHFFFITFVKSEPIKKMLAKNNLDFGSYVTQSKDIKNYLAKLNINSQHQKYIVIPLPHSCPACVRKTGELLGNSLDGDSTIIKIIISNDKNGIDEYIKKYNIKINGSYYLDYTGIYSTYLKNLKNINLITKSLNEYKIKSYSPDELESLILELTKIQK